MQQHKETVKRVIGKINALKESIKKDLAERELEPFLIRCENSLDTMARALNVAIGGEIEQLNNGNSDFIPVPLTSVLDMATNAPVKTTDADVNPRQAEIDKIKAEVNDVYNSILQREPKEILEGTDELILRGVAKKAGLNVDANNPENLSVEFIKEIQTAIQSKIEIAEKIANAKKEAGELSDDEKLAVDNLYNAAVDYYKEKSGEDMGADDAANLRGSIELSVKEGNDGAEQLEQFKKAVDENFGGSNDADDNDKGGDDNAMTKAEMIKEISEWTAADDAPEGYADELKAAQSSNLKKLLHAELAELYVKLKEFAKAV